MFISEIIYYTFNKNNIIQKTNNIYLDDLIKKLLIEKPFDENKNNCRISWEDYFNHSFFNKYPQFEFKCKYHSKINEGYCLNCKNNICEECLNENLNHNIISLNKIGMSKEEKIISEIPKCQIFSKIPKCQNAKILEIWEILAKQQ